MHGLYIRAAERFVTDTCSREVWERIIGNIPQENGEYSTFSVYGMDRLERLIAETSRELAQPIPDLLEDMGTYLVAHPNCETMRRLLRFGGDTFAEALYSMSDIRDRARLAVPNLELPEIYVTACGPSGFEVRLFSPVSEAVFLLSGILRALADDYGALVLIDRQSALKGVQRLLVTLLDSHHGYDRGFQLAVGQVEIW